MDEVYPSQELEFLDKNESAEPIICKMSDIMYRQCQKERERIKQKKTANAYILIVSCLFMSLMIALVVSRYLEDKYTKTDPDLILMNYTKEGIITTTQRSFLDLFKRCCQ